MKERVSLRRMTAFFTSILLVVFCLPTLALPAKAETTVRQVNNIVLFAQFDPLTEKNFMSGDATNTVLSMCNDTTTYRSLTKYIDTISYGQMHVDSYFPQLKDGVIEPYVLSQSRESYTDYNQYAVEMIQNIAIPADIPLDGDNDGYIDNIVCVVDGKVTSAADPLWSKAFYLDGGLQVNGLTVGQVNLHSGYSVIGSTLFNGIGTVCHEFLHSMGYPDLYHRSDVPGDPVGQWDIMATTSIFLQYPLAYQRYSVSGWMGAETITTAGTYALAPASASEGSRLYLLKTPLSDTEFFAVEYRKQGAKYSDELDGKIYGDGMVVYRVNTSVVGNYRGDTDQIYIFRPGETALNGGAGDLTKSCYGGTGAPNHIGTTDLQKKFSDGALVYADGTNSGIALDNIQIQDNGTLTFSVSFADLSGQKLWETSNNSSFSADTMAYDLATAADGTMYLLSTTAYSATLYRVEEDETLTAVSKPFSGSMYNPKLVICDGTAYVLYQDYDYISHLCKWNENGQLWEECYVGTELAQYQDLATDGEQLYFTCTTGSFPYALQAYCYNPNTGQATQIGTDLSGNACNMEIAAADGTVVIGGIAIVGDNPDLRERLGFLQNSVGAISGPFDAFLTLRGVKTLALRMERHCSNALALAQWLERQPQVARVYYPGLASHPQHELAKRQMRGFGGMISLDLRCDLAGARRFLENVRIFSLAESLGGVESLIEHPAIMTHASIPAETRADLGIGDSLIRLSVGVEALEDLQADLAQALAKI